MATHQEQNQAFFSTLNQIQIVLWKVFIQVS